MKIIVATISCDTPDCKNFVLSHAQMAPEVKTEKLMMKSLGWKIIGSGKKQKFFCPNCSMPELATL